MFSSAVCSLSRLGSWKTMPKRLRASFEPVEPNAPARRRQQRRQHLDRRRLARAVRAEEGKDFAFRDVERHVVDGDDIAELLAKAVGLNHGGDEYYTVQFSYASDLSCARVETDAERAPACASLRRESQARAFAFARASIFRRSKFAVRS
jgi:hypothetical protein